jgi:hypothetical protein
MALLDDLGIDKQKFEDATGSTVTAAFEALASGKYPGKVKDLVLFTSIFAKDGVETKATQLRVTVTVTGKDSDGKDKNVDVQFQRDVGKTLKDGAVNEGFINRLKSLCLATNTDIDSLTMGDETKVNSFGKDCEGQFLMGMNDKPLVALVKYMRDENKAEGVAFRDQNFLEGVCPQGSEDIEKFEEKVAKLPEGIFLYKGYVKGGASTSTNSNAGTAENKEQLAKMKF